MDKDNYAVIMAGGVGSRFWPLSKKRLPKQFLDLLGTGETLIQKTFHRLSKIILPEHIFILTNQHYEQLVLQQLPKITERQLILEPAKRNTAPCILLATLKIQKENPAASIIIAPSDHWIENEVSFKKDVEQGFKISQKKQVLMTLGIHPTLPHTGYGYIHFDSLADNGAKPVIKFTEKPNYSTAKSFLESGNYLWNAGIFIAPAKVLTSAFKTFLPAMYQLFSSGLDALNSSREKEFLAQAYPKAKDISIDYGIMEKAKNIEVLPVHFDWNDLGSWGSLYEKMPKDKNENVIIDTQTHLEQASKNIIHIPRGRMVVIRGLEDYIIVENEEILMIYPKEKEQEIRSTRDRVKKEFGEDLG